MQHLDVSGAVRHIYIYIYIYVIRRLKVLPLAKRKIGVSVLVLTLCRNYYRASVIWKGLFACSWLRVLSL